MKFDNSLAGAMLSVFEEAHSSISDIMKLKSQGFDYQNKIIHFHLHALNDKGFIERVDGEDGVGYNEDSHGAGGWSAVRLRLTTDGHEFLEEIRGQ